MTAVVDTVLSKEKVKEIIGKRVAKNFKDGDVITLGIGIPNAALSYLGDTNVVVHSENGIIGIGEPSEGTNYYDKKIVNSGGIPCILKRGGSFFNSEMSLSIMRGGHIDKVVLGALQVDEEGSIASSEIPNKAVIGYGGAMDLIVGAKKVIVAMEHLSRGDVKIVKRCTFPLTAYREVDEIITERCVFEIIDGRMYLVEINPMYTIGEIKASVFADFQVSSELKTMNI